MKLRAVLLCTVLWMPTAAKADPVSLITSALVGLTSTFNAIGIPAILSGRLAVATLQLGASLLLSAASNALFGPKMPKAQNLARELSAPTTEPAFRFVYGETRAAGTPVGTPVRAEYIWGCWLLNSRPSHLPDFKLFLDKREVALTGNAFDFEGSPDGGGTGGTYGGATATEHPFSGCVNVWISRGDQTSPPRQFLEQAPFAEGDDEELWKSTDGWQGRTVIWMRLNAGRNSERQERWPSTPPLVEIEGKWSLVCDPRNAAHDLDDPDTWEWSDNHALCVLDALTQNPIRQYRASNLHLDSFEDAADVADELVSLKSGGSERRYRLAGTLAFDVGEIEDQINPLVLSGAGNLIRIGGRLGLAAGEYRAPTVSVTDFLGEGFEADELMDEHELVTTLRVSYLSPARGYETAQLKPWDIPDALAADGGIRTVRDLALPFCPSATQGMRVRKIEGLRMRRQERITAVLPPECFDLVGGSTLTLSAGDSAFDAFDGIYEVQSVHPGLDPIGESGEVALRLPATLVKHSAAIYAWDEDADEEEVNDEPYIADRKALRQPGAVSAAISTVDAGGASLLQLRFAFAPSPSQAVDSYEWQYREGEGDWTPGGSIDGAVRDGSDKVFGLLQGIAPEAAYDVRVRAVAPAGKSNWVMIENVIFNLSVTVASATAAPGRIDVELTAPDSTVFAGVRIYRSAVGAGFGAAQMVKGLTEGAAGEAFSVTAGEVPENLLSNADFTFASDWSGANWTLSGGVASHTINTPASDLFQTVALTPGANYRFRYSAVSISVGATRFRLHGDSIANSPAESATGTFIGTLTAPAGATQASLFAGNNSDASVDEAFLFEDGPQFLTQGSADYWVVPVSASGTEGAPVGPYQLTIP